MATTIEEVLEALAALGSLGDRLDRIEQKLDALSNGHAEWLDAEASAAYLMRSTGAIERGWRRGTIPSVVSADGRRRSSRSMLDDYQQGRNGGES